MLDGLTLTHKCYKAIKITNTLYEESERMRYQIRVRNCYNRHAVLTNDLPCCLGRKEYYFLRIILFVAALECQTDIESGRRNCVGTTDTY